MHLRNHQDSAVHLGITTAQCVQVPVIVALCWDAVATQGAHDVADPVQ